MDDREEGAGIGGFVLNHWRVLQMLSERGIAAAITREPVGPSHAWPHGLACHRVGDQIDPFRLARDVDLRSCRVPAAGPDVGGSDRPERAEYR
jgi:hypothetical protein